MIAHRRVACALALLIAAGCTDGNVLPPTPDPPVSPHAVWAGSTVTVMTAQLRGRGDTGSVQLGAALLPITRVDDTTVTVTMPEAFSGTFVPIARLGNFTLVLDTLTVYGFAEATSYPIQSDWITSFWPRTGPDARILTSGDDNALQLIDLNTHQINTLAAALSHGGPGEGLWGPGPSYDGAFILQSPTDYGSVLFQSWWLAPTSQPMAGAIPHVIQPDFFTSIRNVMRLGPSTWFVAGKGGTPSIVTGADSLHFDHWAPDTLMQGTMSGLYLSPRGDRATVAPQVTHGGVSVYEVPTGRIAFQVTQINSDVTDADFSSDGALLAMAGASNFSAAGPATTLVVVDASTGANTHDTTFIVNINSVLFSGDRSRLYVAVSIPDSTTAGSHPAVVVLDAASFRRLAILAIPFSLPGCVEGGCSLGRLAYDSSGHLYFFWGAFNSNGSTAARFTIAPAGTQ